MKIRINTKVLASAIAEVLPFAPQKSNIAILKYAKFTTKGNRMKIEANDQQCSIRKYVTAESIDTEQSFLVDCADFCKYISSVKSDIVELDVDNDTIIVQHDKGNASFQTFDVSNYPDFDMPTDDMVELALPTSLISDCIASAKDFVSNDTFNESLRSIYVFVKDGKFGYCGTDTRKMASNTTPVDVSTDIDIWWLINPFAFGAITKASKDADLCNIKITKSHVSYRFGNTIIQTTQANGTYPQFERVIPKSWQLECVVDKSDILDSLRRVSLTTGTDRCIKMRIDPNTITLSADDIDLLKKSSETMQHGGCNGEITIGMQVDSMLNCLNACLSKDVIMRFTDASRPVIFCDTDSASKVILVMPMTINNL